MFFSTEITSQVCRVSAVRYRLPNPTGAKAIRRYVAASPEGGPRTRGIKLARKHIKHGRRKLIPLCKYIYIYIYIERERERQRERERERERER